MKGSFLSQLIPIIRTQMADPGARSIVIPVAINNPVGRPHHFPTYTQQSQIITFNVPLHTPLTVSDWIVPSTEHKDLNTPFCGVDRSLDPTRLAGISWTTYGSCNVTEVINDAVAYANREGAACTDLFVPRDVANSIDWMGELKSTAGIVFINTTYGRFQIHAANISRSYLLQRDTWINIVDDKGKHITLACAAPGYNMVIEGLNEPGFECVVCGAFEEGHNWLYPCGTLSD